MKCVQGTQEEQNVSTLLSPTVCFFQLFVSSAKHRHYEKTLKSSGKCFIYGKLLRHTNKVSLRFLLRDTLHEAFFTGYQEGNIIDNHS